MPSHISEQMDRDEQGRFVAMGCNGKKNCNDGEDWLGSALKGAGAGAAGYGAAKGVEKGLSMSGDLASKAGEGVRKATVSGRKGLKKLLRGTSLGKAAAVGGLGMGGMAALRGLLNDEDDEE
jgi:hypothetical protein